MEAGSHGGGFADPAIDAARAFRAAMHAMARPGEIRTLDGAAPPAPMSPAAGALLLTLCDPDTGLFLAGAHDSAAVRGWIAFHTGAPVVTAPEAMFALGAWDALAPLERFSIGTPDYPDRSATLIVEWPGLTAVGGATLTGPGIRDTARLALPDVAALQANAARYPLGWDLFLTHGAEVAALPRSTRIGGV